MVNQQPLSMAAVQDVVTHKNIHKLCQDLPNFKIESGQKTKKSSHLSVKDISTLKPNFTIAYDPSARTMTDFDINAMPTSFIVDKKGKIHRRIIGYKADEIAQTKADIEALF